MSALYVTCPSCGPLFTFIPQGGQFTVDVKCPCGIKLTHTENCNNSQSAKELRARFARYHGKVPVQQKEVPLKMNKENNEQGGCFD